MTGRRRAATSAELAARLAAVDADDQADDDASTSAAPQLRTSAPTPADRPAAPVRTRPVRTTVEMSPLEHAALRRWCAEAAGELGVPLVAGAEVLRALWALTRDDPQLAERVMAQLRASGGSRRRW